MWRVSLKFATFRAIKNIGKFCDQKWTGNDIFVTSSDIFIYIDDKQADCSIAGWANFERHSDVSDNVLLTVLRCWWPFKCTNWYLQLKLGISLEIHCCVHTNIFYQKRKNLNMISVKLSWTSNDLKLIETFSTQIQNTSNVILFEIQTMFALQIISEGPCTIFITVIQSIHGVTRAQHKSKTRYKQYTATQVQDRSWI